MDNSLDWFISFVNSVDEFEKTNPDSISTLQIRARKRARKIIIQLKKNAPEKIIMGMIQVFERLESNPYR